MEKRISEMKQTEDKLLVKCNMLESTDPELANIFKEIWEKEAIKLKTNKGKNIPLLNLKPLLNKEYSYEEEGTN